MLTGTFLWAFPVIPHAGTQADPAVLYSSLTASLVFNDIYTMEAIKLNGIECEILSETGTPVTTWELLTGWTMNGTDVRVPIQPLIVPLANGIYRVRVRVWDDAGNVSGWSDTMWVTKWWRTVPSPGGCRTLP